MFSANENLALRQYKKKVVEYVETCIPDDALDMGTMVMAMQVSCKAPGCVPLETAIVIVFPKLGNVDDCDELIPGLPESRGGNYKTKVLKPMAEVTQEDILEALPPEFPGGRRSVEKLCIQARDVMLGQITQLFADEDKQGRELMAKYLQQCLQEYLDRDCTPPEWGEAFPPTAAQEKDEEGNMNTVNTNESQQTPVSTTTAKQPAPVTKTGNFVFKRPADSEREDDNKGPSTGTIIGTSAGTSSSSVAPSFSSSHSAATTTSSTTKPKQTTTTTTSSQSIIAQLGERQHAPGIRRPGCPCCDPDNADNLIDEMMGL